ncbi:transcriptional regulator, TetR family [Rhizobiales bacterium GAS191]|jgi:AcrR family transcriptional regulator|nr:transcriptional regulator, TetR family [Rhizobiales bacterium GAS191]
MNRVIDAVLDTPSRILEIAEELFAEQGYRAVSLRSITRACGANIAAVHYHFGSKEVVLERIFEMRCSTMNGERLRMLDACREGRGRPPMLEQVLDAYLRPALTLPGGDERARRFMRLRAAVAHEHAELSQQLVAKYFNEVSGRFIDVLMKLLKHLSPQDVYWRFHFLLGAQYYTLANPGRIQALSDGLCNPSDTDRAIKELIAFVAAGLRAPATRHGLEASSASRAKLREAR